MTFDYQKFKSDFTNRLDRLEYEEFREYFKDKSKKLKDYVEVCQLPLQGLIWTPFTKESCGLPEEIATRLSNIVSLYFPNKHEGHLARKM